MKLRLIPDIICAVCIGIPMIVVGYLAGFVVGGLVTGFNWQSKS